MSIIGTAISAVVGGPVGWAISAFGSVKSAIGGALSWTMQNTAHLLLVAVALVGLWGWYGHHETAKWRKVANSTEIARKADNRTWAGADKINHGTIGQLIGTLNDQSNAVRTWADTATAKQNAAQAALRAATARGARMEALAGAIDAERAQRGSSGTGCVSGKAVMAARGSL